MRKLIFPIAAFAMAAFVACGDDSSSNSASTTPANDTTPATDTQAGAMVSCDIPGAVGECMEFAAGSPEAVALESQCVSVLMGVLGKGCAK